MSEFEIGCFVKLSSFAEKQIPDHYFRYKLCIGKVLDVTYHGVQECYFIQVKWLPSNEVFLYTHVCLKKTSLKAFI